MKMPENPADIKKIIVAAVLGLGLIVYGLKAGVFEPLNKRIDRLTTDLESAESRQAAARQYLQDIAPRRVEQRESVARLAAFLDDVGFVLEPSLGNYELPAQQRFLRWTSAAGIETTPQIRGRNPQPLRWPAWHKQPPLLAIFPLNVSFRADLETTLRLLAIIQQENPACGIAGLTIAAQAAEPLMHQVSLELEWPVWAREDAYETVISALSEALTSVEPERP